MIPGDTLHDLPAIQAGRLYLVSTPIGHLGDLSPRAAHALLHCDTIACEDTRTTRRLLNHIGSRQPTLAYHDHNEAALAPVLAERILAGESIALVSDAGTPNLSDPGFRLVRECRRRGIPVECIPGANAILTALCASGLPTHGFLYAGFLAPKSAARQRFLERFRDFDYTLVIYESCHRVAKLVDDIIGVLGEDRTIAVARELTKRHETFLIGPAASVRGNLTGNNLRGEFVVLVASVGYQL